MRILQLEGTHSAMGEAFGSACRTEIQAFYQLRVRNALAQAKAYGGRTADEAALLSLAKKSLGPTEAYDPRGYEELLGIARGADMPAEKILAMNGLTDFRDTLAWGGDLEQFGGCSAFIAQRDFTHGGSLLCGQTWDLATDNMPFVLGIVRKPTVGPATWCLTTVGCLSLIGMNEHQVAVGTTNLRTTDARTGVTYLSVIHRALACETAVEAKDAVVAAPRAAAHYFYVADKSGRAFSIECTATDAEVQPVEAGYAVHCNHSLVERFAKIEAQTPTASTHARQKRLGELLEAERGSLDLERAGRLFADASGGENAICRRDFGGISTNGAIVMNVDTGNLSACHGLPSEARWVDLKLEAAELPS